MLIDWFTVGAQLLNFLILVWLLKRFLYKPVLDAIEVREKRIASELADADAKKAEAQKERDAFQAKNAAFDAQRGALMDKAAADAKLERDRLLEKVHRELDALRAGQTAVIRKEQTSVGKAMAQLVTEEVFEVSRKALADLANVSLEERIGEVFTRRLRELDPQAKAALAGALRTSTEPATVRSTFDLGPGQRSAIQNALNEDFSAEIRVSFETAPAGICGIELNANSQKVSWNIAEYLSSLELKTAALLNAPPVPVNVAQPVRVEPPPLASVA